ncbi:MAG: toprim domain-containing protein [Gammaproteobacteria bacterium]|nr:toprim domain-containing protein [Gammaproteobacteria bacterium]
MGGLGATPASVVVAEGLIDWLALAAWNIPACAALGTHGVDRIAEALRGAGQVFLAFDADDAGREAARRLERLLGGRAAVVDLPQGIGDIADLAQHPHGRATFSRLLQRAAARRRQTPRTRL